MAGQGNTMSQPCSNTRMTRGGRLGNETETQSAAARNQTPSTTRTPQPTQAKYPSGHLSLTDVVRRNMMRVTKIYWQRIRRRTQRRTQRKKIEHAATQARTRPCKGSSQAGSVVRPAKQSALVDLGCTQGRASPHLYVGSHEGHEHVPKLFGRNS